MQSVKFKITAGSVFPVVIKLVRKSDNHLVDILEVYSTGEYYFENVYEDEYTLYFFEKVNGVEYLCYQYDIPYETTDDETTYEPGISYEFSFDDFVCEIVQTEDESTDDETSDDESTDDETTEDGTTEDGTTEDTEIECDCKLTFDTYEDGAYSILSIGVLEGGNCEFDEYVIDWYLDNNLQFSTGSSTNIPGVSRAHPFDGTGAIPVEPGDWVPKVRYVVLQGTNEKIYPEPTEGEVWCDFNLEDFPDSIEVKALGCGITGDDINTPGLHYDYKLSYTANDDISMASRRVHFNLDNTSKYFAFKFHAYEVADQLTIYHSSDLVNPVVDVIVGTEAAYSGLEKTPPELKRPYLTQYINLPAYTQDDYLLIEVTPSVLSANPNTEWVLNMICLDDSIPFDTELSYFGNEIRAWDKDEFDMIQNMNDCTYDFSLDYIESEPALTYLRRYAGLVTGLSANYLNYSDSAYITLQGGSSSNITSNDTIIISKTSSELKFTCGDIDDYNILYNSYQALLNSNYYANYINDDTDINYYKSVIVKFNSKVNGCGDSGTDYNIEIHFSTIYDNKWVFDSNNLTLTITLSPILNGFTNVMGDCNTLYDDINVFVNSINYSHSVNHGTIYSRCLNEQLFQTVSSMAYKINGTNVTYSKSFLLHYQHSIPVPINNNLPWEIASSEYKLYKTRLVFSITAQKDVNGDWIDDPLLNWKVEAVYNPNTNGTSQPVTIYEVEDDGQGGKNVITNLTYAQYLALF